MSNSRSTQFATSSEDGSWRLYRGTARRFFPDARRAGARRGARGAAGHSETRSIRMCSSFDTEVSANSRDCARRTSGVLSPYVVEPVRERAGTITSSSSCEIARALPSGYRHRGAQQRGRSPGPRDRFIGGTPIRLSIALLTHDPEEALAGPGSVRSNAVDEIYLDRSCSRRTSSGRHPSRRWTTPSACAEGGRRCAGRSTIRLMEATSISRSDDVSTGSCIVRAEALPLPGKA